jgi:hypothetical protein
MPLPAAVLRASGRPSRLTAGWVPHPASLTSARLVGRDGPLKRACLSAHVALRPKIAKWTVGSVPLAYHPRAQFRLSPLTRGAGRLCVEARRLKRHLRPAPGKRPGRAGTTESHQRRAGGRQASSTPERVRPMGEAATTREPLKPLRVSQRSMKTAGWPTRRSFNRQRLFWRGAPPMALRRRRKLHTVDRAAWRVFSRSRLLLKVNRQWGGPLILDRLAAVFEADFGNARPAGQGLSVSWRRPYFSMR